MKLVCAFIFTDAIVGYLMQRVVFFRHAHFLFLIHSNKKSIEFDKFVLINSYVKNGLAHHYHFMESTLIFRDIRIDFKFSFYLFIIYFFFF